MEEWKINKEVSNLEEVKPMDVMNMANRVNQARGA
jgi:hypothetical protein